MQMLKTVALCVVVALAALLVGRLAIPRPPRIVPMLDTIVRYEARFKDRIRVDTVRERTVSVLHDTAFVLMARADSAPPDSAVPLLRRACFTLDSALTTCEERVSFWRADADTVRSQRDTLASLLRRLPQPRRCKLGGFLGYGVRGPDVGVGILCGW